MNRSRRRTTFPLIFAALCACLLAVFPACQGLRPGEHPQRSPLRVGVTPDYPPIIFRADARMKGVEADLARKLARELDRPLTFVSMRWDKQIPALLRGDTDIIMSGMSITPARLVRIRFSEPYLETGLMTLLRRIDEDRYRTPEDVLEAAAVVGYKKGTTAERFVRERFVNANRRSYRLASDAALDLTRNRLDLFIDDGPSIAWLVSANESELTALFVPLTKQQLAWGFRREDTEWLASANAILRGWKQDGTLDEVLDLWLPYREWMKP